MKGTKAENTEIMKDPRTGRYGSRNRYVMSLGEGNYWCGIGNERFTGQE